MQASYLHNNILPNHREDVRRPITRRPHTLAASSRFSHPFDAAAILRVAPGSCPERTRQIRRPLCPREMPSIRDRCRDLRLRPVSSCAKPGFATTAGKIALAERLLCLAAYADCLIHALDTPVLHRDKRARCEMVACDLDKGTNVGRYDASGGINSADR
jgi:hypothetical protein